MLAGLGLLPRLLRLLGWLSVLYWQLSVWGVWSALSEAVSAASLR